MTTVQDRYIAATLTRVGRSSQAPRWELIERGLTACLTAISVAILVGEHPGYAAVVLALGATAAAFQIRTSRQARELNLDLEEASALVQVDQARMHEVKSTLAGITSASTLIREHPDLDESRRGRLEKLLGTELERLGRMLADPRDAPIEYVDLDEVIGHFADVHRTHDHHIDWSFTGIQVLGRTDDVAEVLHILMDNARKHGRGRARVEVTYSDGVATVLVTDDGPGVKPEMFDQVFEWGIRSPTSSGSGLGLTIARGLVEAMGGRLQLVATATGSAFVARMPAAIPVAVDR